MGNVTIFYQFFKGRKKKREEDNKAPPKKMAKRKHRLVRSHASKACGAQRSLGQTMRFSKRHIVPGRPACPPAVGPRALKRVRRQAALLSPENWWLTSSVKEALMRRGGGGQKNRSLGTCFLFSLSPPSPAAAPPTRSWASGPAHSFTGFPSFQASGPNRWAHLCFHENVPKQWNNQQQSV